MKTLLIHGAYSIDNYGDTLLLAMFAKYVMGKGLQVRVSYGSEKALRHLPDDVKLFDGKLTNDVAGLLYGGGGYFGEPPERQLRWHLHLMRKHLPIGFRCHQRKLPFAVIGAGLGPLSFFPSRMMTANLLSKAKVIGLRDEESCKALAQYGVSRDQITETADLALSLFDDDSLIYDGKPRPKKDPGAKVVTLHLSYPRDYDASQQMIFDEVAAFAREHPDWKFLAITDQKTPQQQEMLADCVALLGADRMTCEEYESYQRTTRLLAESSVVLTNKLHVAIVSSTFGAQVLSLAKHPKTLRFFKQLGRPELCKMREHLQSGELLSFLEGAASGQVSPIKVPEELREKSRNNYALIDKFLAFIKD